MKALSILLALVGVCTFPLHLEAQDEDSVLTRFQARFDADDLLIVGTIHDICFRSCDFAGPESPIQGDKVIQVVVEEVFNIQPSTADTADEIRLAGLTDLREKYLIGSSEEIARGKRVLIRRAGDYDRQFILGTDDRERSVRARLKKLREGLPEPRDEEMEALLVAAGEHDVLAVAIVSDIHPVFIEDEETGKRTRAARIHLEGFRPMRGEVAPDLTLQLLGIYSGKYGGDCLVLLPGGDSSRIEAQHLVHLNSHRKGVLEKRFGITFEKSRRLR